MATRENGLGRNDDDLLLSRAIIYYRWPTRERSSIMIGFEIGAHERGGEAPLLPAPAPFDRSPTSRSARNSAAISVAAGQDSEMSFDWRSRDNENHNHN